MPIFEVTVIDEQDVTRSVRFEAAAANSAPDAAAEEIAERIEYDFASVTIDGATHALVRDDRIGEVVFFAVRNDARAGRSVELRYGSSFILFVAPLDEEQ